MTAYGSLALSASVSLINSPGLTGDEELRMKKGQNRKVKLDRKTRKMAHCRRKGTGPALSHPPWARTISNDEDGWSPIGAMQVRPVFPPGKPAIL